MFLPGGGAPSAGHGVLAFTTLGGFGCGLGFGVLRTGTGVGAAVGRGVTRGVGRGVGAAVGAAVGTAVGAAVAGPAGTGVAAPAGTGDAAAGDGVAAGLGSIDGVRLAGGALATALGSNDGVPPDGEVGGWLSGAVGDAGAVVGGTTATGPLERFVAASCC